MGKGGVRLGLEGDDGEDGGDPQGDPGRHRPPAEPEVQPGDDDNKHCRRVDLNQIITKWPI